MHDLMDWDKLDQVAPADPKAEAVDDPFEDAQVRSYTRPLRPCVVSLLGANAPSI